MGDVDINGKRVLKWLRYAMDSYNSGLDPLVGSYEHLLEPASSLRAGGEGFCFMMLVTYNLRINERAFFL
jgi:hypothetical protein